MKLNYKRTFLVGFAFLSISAFWQLYDTIIPLILRDTYALPDGPAGIIMGLDNVVALFLLPLFGSVSDGNRSPKWAWFAMLGAGLVTGAVSVLTGMPASAAWLTATLPWIAGSLPTIELISEILASICAAALVVLPVMTLLARACAKLGRRIPYILFGTIGAVLSMAVLMYTEHFLGLLFFGAALGILLIFMGAYRSPAVALMPDVTPKPVRSKGNAIINLMGAVGGAFSLVAINLLVGERAGGLREYVYLFLAVGVLMLLAALVVVFTVPEHKYVQQMRDINYGVSEEDDQSKAVEVDGKEKLPPAVRTSLLLILATITLWFFGYNAVTTAFSKFATKMWASGLEHVANCLLIATAAAIVSYLPIGFLASRIGRKKTIVIGLLVATVCFVFGAVGAKTFTPMLYVMFAAVGFAQAAVTVNTFPMVWEISRYGNVGKYTGYYYTCSMAAQIVTPVISGYLLQYVGYGTLFPYAAIFVALAIIPVVLTKYGDSKPGKPKSKLEAMQGADD
jgi:maltose/moltooligosaccharide transporter